MMWQEIKSEVALLPTNAKSLRKFGVTMAIVLGLFVLLAWYRESGLLLYMAILAIAFLLTGTLRPTLLKTIYLWWMTVATTMGYFMTRIILALLFYVAFTIIGLIARFMTKDMLDQQQDSNASTYWKPYQPAKNRKEQLERQF